MRAYAKSRGITSGRNGEIFSFALGDLIRFRFCSGSLPVARADDNTCEFIFPAREPYELFKGHPHRAGRYDNKPGWNARLVWVHKAWVIWCWIPEIRYGSVKEEAPKYSNKGFINGRNASPTILLARLKLRFDLFPRCFVLVLLKEWPCIHWIPFNGIYFMPGFNFCQGDSGRIGFKPCGGTRFLICDISRDFELS